MIERHAEALLGVRFLATEFPTTKSYGGRIDTLGIDESGSPVIIEYKRAINENVINQGLFYLTWLLDHRADFKLLVLERLGAEVAATIEWGSPRLICIAGTLRRTTSMPSSRCRATSTSCGTVGTATTCCCSSRWPPARSRSRSLNRGGSGYIRRITSGWSEVDILKSEDVERALPLIAKSYHRS